MSLALVQAQRLNSWIDSFIEHTANIQSPEIFRRWSAITTIGAALERKVWVVLSGGEVYPNVYTVLVGPPGSGKGETIKQARDFWRGLKDHHKSPTSLSKAALIDSLHLAKRRIIRPGSNPEYTEFNSLYIISGELGVLLPSYDNDFMNVLTDLYDCQVYHERRRTKELDIEIPHPQFNILAGTTPSYLNGVMPEGAWNQGFISRVFMVYSGAKPPSDLFESTDESNLSTDLQSDLELIGRQFGKIGFTSAARDIIRAWHMAGGEPIPEHPKLAHYVSRRSVHLIKLCMIAAASRGRMTIDLEEFQTALDWMTEAEHTMSDVFLSMGRGDTAVIEDTWYYLYQTFIKEKKAIAEPRLIEFLLGRTPEHNVMKIIEMMVRAKLIIAEYGKMTTYKPAPKRNL